MCCVRASHRGTTAAAHTGGQKEHELTWAPVQQKHAIERLRIDIAFTEQLPARVVDTAKRTFEQVRHQVRFAEPVPQEVHQFQFQPGMAAPTVAQKASGWQSIRESSPGVVVEAIALNQGGFSYESTDYRGWDTAYKRVLSVSAEIVRQFATVVDFRSFGIDYMDRFVYQGDAGQASPSDILQDALLASLTEGARSGQFLWHLHRGWFERLNERSILMNQNVDAQDAKTHTGMEVRSLQIFTRAEFRPEPEQFVVQDLDDIADQLHILCNGAFSSILTDSAKQMVGL